MRPIISVIALASLASHGLGADEPERAAPPRLGDCVQLQIAEGDMLMRYWAELDPLPLDANDRSHEQRFAVRVFHGTTEAPSARAECTTTWKLTNGVLMLGFTDADRGVSCFTGEVVLKRDPRWEQFIGEAPGLWSNGRQATLIRITLFAATRPPTIDEVPPRK